MCCGLETTNSHSRASSVLTDLRHQISWTTLNCAHLQPWQILRTQDFNTMQIEQKPQMTVCVEPSKQKIVANQYTRNYAYSPTWPFHFYDWAHTYYLQRLQRS